MYVSPRFERRIDVRRLLFTKPTINAEMVFSDGRSLYCTLDDLLRGNIKPADLPLLDVRFIDGRYYSLNTRVLVVLKMYQQLCDWDISVLCTVKYGYERMAAWRSIRLSTEEGELLSETYATHKGEMLFTDDLEIPQENRSAGTVVRAVQNLSFTHDTIDSRMAFRNKMSMYRTLDGLIRDEIISSDLPPLDVFEDENGTSYSMSNRRLTVLKLFVIFTDEEVVANCFVRSSSWKKNKFSRALTSENSGRSIVPKSVGIKYPTHYGHRLFSEEDDSEEEFVYSSLDEGSEEPQRMKPPNPLQPSLVKDTVPASVTRNPVPQSSVMDTYPPSVTRGPFPLSMDRVTVPASVTRNPVPQSVMVRVTDPTSVTRNPTKQGNMTNVVVRKPANKSDQTNIKQEGSSLRWGRIFACSTCFILLFFSILLTGYYFINKTPEKNYPHRNS
eukprot:TRINITY_DN2083_c0_g1_i1.p1 TRINITY_DN2083_c0_g1~~TRINITY_DN2083_c0_g1_i1.p1  ORF type:complete len:443 (+),score=39.11 TRINITY_DN2083_c0_g1_i1:221-1549(+)